MTYYPIFISSPGDRQQERKYAEEVIAEVGAVLKDSADLAISVIKWEKLPPAMARPNKTKQEEINELIHDCKAFILILGERYGTIEPGNTVSNTEREIEEALRVRESRPGFQILTYFKDLPPDPDPGNQRQQVEALKQRLNSKGIFYFQYQKSSAFRERLIHDLYKILLNFRISNTKTIALRRFWRMGIVDGPARYNTMIIFPPAAPPCTKLTNQGQICDVPNRMAPLVVFEDYKAIVTISKSLQLVGVTTVGDCAVDYIPRDIDMMNRIWLCLPRNIPAHRRLSHYHDRRFEFNVRRNKSRFIEWKSNSKIIHIESPLETYRQEQERQHSHQISRDNHSIIAKDFAVIARFCDKTKQDMERGHLMDYFFAGIRGLGTWGATWFVARRYNAFLNMDIADDYKDVQMLVEVTYIRGRITEVIDVSNESAAYFRQQNSISKIRKEITIHRGG
jgi:hypothetical protein